MVEWNTQTTENSSKPCSPFCNRHSATYDFVVENRNLISEEDVTCHWQVLLH